MRRSESPCGLQATWDLMCMLGCDQRITSWVFKGRKIMKLRKPLTVTAVGATLTLFGGGQPKRGPGLRQAHR